MKKQTQELIQIISIIVIGVMALTGGYLTGFNNAAQKPRAIDIRTVKVKVDCPTIIESYDWQNTIPEKSEPCGWENDSCKDNMFR